MNEPYPQRPPCFKPAAPGTAIMRDWGEPTPRQLRSYKCRMLLFFGATAVNAVSFALQLCHVFPDWDIAYKVLQYALIALMWGLALYYVFTAKHQARCGRAIWRKMRDRRQIKGGSR